MKNRKVFLAIGLAMAVVGLWTSMAFAGQFVIDEPIGFSTDDSYIGALNPDQSYTIFESGGGGIPTHAYPNGRGGMDIWSPGSEDFHRSVTSDGMGGYTVHHSDGRPPTRIYGGW